MRSSSLVAGRRKLALCLLAALGAAASAAAGCLEPISVGGSTGQVTQEAEWVGNPCTPNDEKNAAFPGFKITETTIDKGAPECGGGAGVCLVNHFQGRVSCPLGQPAPVDANGLPGCVAEYSAQGELLEAQGSCEAGSLCVQAASVSPACDPSTGDEAELFCLSFGPGSSCNAGGFCQCLTDSDCIGLADYARCDVQSKQCLTFACQSSGGCQDSGASASENAGKVCCAAGTDAPLSESVCGQCTGTDNGPPARDAENAVYCSCRCGVAEGAPEEPDFDFCTCPGGFECSEIQPYSGLGDTTVAGKYCIKAGTAYDPTQDQCGFVDGHWTAGGGGLTCAGAPSGG